MFFSQRWKNICIDQWLTYLLHIGKNPSKSRPWTSKYDLFHNSSWVWLQAAQPQENVAIYTLVWKQYFQLLSWHKILTYYIIIYKYFFLKTGNLIIKWLFLSYTTCCIERLSSPSNKIWRQEAKLEKSQFSNSLVNWEKSGKATCSRLFKNPNFPSLSWIG